MKIFLFGYYGFKNLGDELLLIKILEDLQKVVPQAKFYIWTSDPNFTENFLKEFLVKSVYRDNPEDTVSAIKNSDIVILGGGGIIQEYYGINVVDLFRNSGKGVASYAIPPLIGKIFNKKVFYWCLGHSPVITDEAIYFSRFFYSLADVITLRDEYSFSTLKELIKEEKTSIYLDVDPLLDLDLSKYLKEPKEKILGVSLRSWFNNKFLIEKVSQALNELLKEDKDLKLFLIPFDLNLDIEIIEALKNYFPSDRLYSFEIKTLEDVIEALSQCKFFLGMRLHSLILAYKLNKPFLTLSYDVKTEEFVNLVNGDFIKTTELNEKELFFKLKKLLVSEPLPLKSFPYKTPLIFEEFIKKNFSLETSKISSISEFLEKEKRYWQDFVKTLMLQRESFYGKIAELETKTKNLETERDRLKVERDELKEERDRLKVERDELKEERDRLKVERDEFSFKLSEIYSSNFWKLAQKYYYLRDHTFLKHLYPYYKPLLDKIFKKKSKNLQIVFKEELNKKEIIENFLKDAQKILIIISSTPFNPLYNQRPLNISKEFVKNGYSVLFVTWQWSREDVVASSYEEICKGIMPLPLYDFLDLYNIFHFPAKEKIYYLSFPVKEFLSTIRILRARGFKILYDIMDDWEGFYEVNQAPWYDKTVEEAILLEADYIIAINLYLLEKFSHLRKDIVLVGNAYNSEILGIDAKFIGGSRVREKFKAGYYGWLDESVFDWEYIFEIARSYPEIDIELIGYGLSESIQRKIEKYSNIKYLGKIYPSELKNYVATWNVAMIPFREKAISKGSDPLKVYEYIYFGIPVAVKGIEAIKDYPLVFYLNSKKDFKVLIEKFDTREKIIAFRETQRERIEKFLSESTWEARVKRILEVIKEETFWT